MNTNSIIENFKKAYPGDTIVAYRFQNGGASTYSGQKLLDVDLNDGYYLRVFKLSKSSGNRIDDDNIKALAFPFVYETRNITDGGRRRDILNVKLTKMFPNHNVNIFIFNDSYWSRNGINTKGASYFEKGYGSEVDVVLS